MKSKSIRNFDGDRCKVSQEGCSPRPSLARRAIPLFRTRICSLLALRPLARQEGGLHHRLPAGLQQWLCAWLCAMALRRSLTSSLRSRRVSSCRAPALALRLALRHGSAQITVVFVEKPKDRRVQGSSIGSAPGSAPWLCADHRRLR